MKYHMAPLRQSERERRTDLWSGLGARDSADKLLGIKTVGANPPYWLTHETNSVARQLYDRLGKNQGFIQYQYTPNG